MTKIFGASLAVLFTIGMTSVQAAEPSYGCMRTTQYSCTVTSAFGNPLALGVVTLDEKAEYVEGFDNNSGYYFSAGTRLRDSKTLLFLSVYEPATANDRRFVSSASAYFGTEMVLLSVPTTGRGGPETMISCVQTDRRPDANGRRYVVDQAPPAPPTENVVPKRGYIWSPSAWENYNGKWTLKAGHWMREKANTRGYEAGEWFYCDGRYRWADARWLR